MGIQIGDKVGDYEVVGILGRGGMGKVFRVRSLLTLREEAMKVIAEDLGAQPDLAERFLREIRVHASLEHPNIAALHSAIRVDDRIVMILELVDGIGLEDIVKRGPISAANVLDYAGQVLSALQYTHNRGVIHRDIKPPNILVTRTGQIKLTDFGIAVADSELRLSRRGMVVGSLPYMAPEQIRSGTVDVRSDIYSLGVTLYEMTTGKRPFQGTTEYQLIEAHMKQAPRPPAEVTPGVPASLSDGILRAMAKDPGDRFQSAEEFHAALDGVSADAPTALGETTLLLSQDELARVESGLVKVVGPIARHMVASAVRRSTNLQDLCARLAEQIPDAREREQFLKTGLGTAPAPGTIAVRRPTTDSGPRTWDQAWLSKLEQALTAYVGPIARVLVKKATQKTRTPDELCEFLAAEIASETDRRAFLKTTRR